MSIPRIKILVFTHKKAPCLSNEVYMPIQVGRAEVDFDLGYQTDNEGIHIGDKHYTFSEYSGLYWGWKNLKDIDYIGWCHYRRYFCLNDKKDYSRENIVVSEAELFKMNFSTDSLKDYFSEYDVILPIKRVFPTSIWDTMKKFHDARDLEITEGVLLEHHPEYMPTFNKYLKHSNKLEQSSIFITKWPIFINYCNWLFPILFEIEKRSDPKLNSLNSPRKIGYIAEQLSPLFFHHNKYKIKHLPIAFVNPVEKKKSWIRFYGSNIKSTLKFWFNIQ